VSEPVLVVESVEVAGRFIEARVRVTDRSLMRTSARPRLAEDALALLPGLARHTCENDDGRDFRRELRDTETPHLLEHVATELAALSGSPRSLRAETRWDFGRDGQGVFRLRFAFDDDLVMLGALREAVTVVEWLFGESSERPDVDAEVERLRALRS
jgi:hypothetical protein